MTQTAPQPDRVAQHPGPLFQEADRGGQPPKPVVSLCWPEYFKQFCQLHGGNPLMFGGVLLFQDGWTHSAHDHAGPEWPPPEDKEECRQLIRQYWLRRRAVVTYEYEQLLRHVERLEELQRHRQAPLQQVVQWLNTEDKRWQKDIGPLDLTAMKGRIEWLREDVQVCEDKLTELERGN